MEIYYQRNEIQAAAREARKEGRRIAWVPSLGALHDGHRLQIEKARDVADWVVVSAFLDPEEFGTNEDFDQYPRVPDEDKALCEEMGVDALYFPKVEELYPEGRHSTYVEEFRVASGLCGISRSTHFRGVATTFVKLAQLLAPDLVVFSRHKIQRLGVIRRVVRDLFLPIEVVETPVAREPDGLASDARNRYLNDSQRGEAAQIYRALQAGKRILEEGNTSVDRITAEVINQLRLSRRLHVLYAHVVDPENLNLVRDIKPGETLLCVGVLIDQIRLVDHVVL